MKDKTELIFMWNHFRRILFMYLCIQVVLLISFKSVSSQNAAIKEKQNLRKNDSLEKSFKVIRSFYPVKLHLNDDKQYLNLKDAKYMLGLKNTMAEQEVLVDTNNIKDLSESGIKFEIYKIKENSFRKNNEIIDFMDPEVSFAINLPGDSLDPEMSFNYNIETPYYSNGVDIGCENMLSGQAGWIINLPYQYAQSYNYLNVGYFGGGTGWPNPGLMILLYDWSTDQFDALTGYLGTQEGWRFLDIDTTIGHYVGPIYHEILFVLYSLMGCNRVSEITCNGDYNEYTDLIIRRSILPNDYLLFQNYPNPFNSRTMIRFDLPRSCEIEMSIYNIIGRRVKTLVSGFYEAGYHKIIWDGIDDNGMSVSSGVCFYRLSTAEYNWTRKMVIIR